MVDPSLVRVTGPLEPFAASFAAELSQQRYKPKSAYPHMRLCAHLSCWLVAEARGGARAAPAAAHVSGPTAGRCSPEKRRRLVSP